MKMKRESAGYYSGEINEKKIRIEAFGRYNQFWEVYVDGIKMYETGSYKDCKNWIKNKF